MITSEVPQSWQELQNEVARIFRECEFTVEVEKIVPNVRGQTEIDVYAEEVVDDRRYVILCECKYWRARIPQSVVHGFRTVMADVGANLGLIIASTGFQTGSTEAAAFTNVKLVTWEEFQAQFEQTWLTRFLIPTVTKRCDPLLTFTEPFLPVWFGSMPPKDQEKYIALKKRNDEFGLLMMQFTKYSRMNGKSLPALPLRTRLQPILQDGSYLPDSVLDALAYREFLESALSHSDEIVSLFRSLRPRDA